MPPVITVKNVSKIFQEKNQPPFSALKDISLFVHPGEIFVLAGPSGCGKSTLLRVMCGLDSASRGQVRLSPDILPRDISFVFQQFALLPWMTVYENTELNLLSRGLDLRARKKKVMKELSRMGIEKFAQAHPRELSGGMRQRVGIARAFVSDPKVIFMDEPFSELDSFTAEELRAELLAIWHERKPTIVMVTHLVEEALELADRIAVMTPRPGRIEKIVTNTLPRPRNRRTPEFFALEDELYSLIRP